MKRKRVMKVCLFTGMLLILSFGSIRVCTSFAVYSDRIFYGMNFDYDPSLELKFCVEATGDIRVFCMRLEWEGGYFVPIVAMNTGGLFGNVQMVFPAVPGNVFSGQEEMEMTDHLLPKRYPRPCLFLLPMSLLVTPTHLTFTLSL